MASNLTTDVSATTDDDGIEHHIDQQSTKSKDKDKRFVIVTAGKAGVGKSTLINNFLELVGDAAFEARPGPNSVTKSVDHCDREINGVQIRVIDMPGLHAVDSGVRTDTSEDILGDLKALTGEGVDVVFYCINLMNRLENVDFENLSTLKKAFGSKIWEHVIFVFTYTDFAMFNGSSPEELVEGYIKVLNQKLVKKSEVNVEIRSIYSFPTDQLSEDAEINTFNGIVGIPVSKNLAIPENWRITLLLQVIRKCRKESIPALLKLKYLDWNEVIETAATFTSGALGGAFVGTVVGGGIGGVIGGALTAPIGGVGAVPTAAAGAELGACIGMLGGSSVLGVTALVTRVAIVVSARHKIEKRARHKIKEISEKEKNTAQQP